MNPALVNYMQMQGAQVPQGAQPMQYKQAVPPMSPSGFVSNQQGMDAAYNAMPMSAPRSNPALGSAAEDVIAPQRDPIASGAERGMQARTRSYELNEEQKRQALGQAMMAFFSAMGSSQNPSRLGSFNEGFMPALNQFNAARAQAMGLNRQETIDEEAARQHAERMAFEYAREGRLASQPKGGLQAGSQVALKTNFTRAKKEYDIKLNEVTDALYNTLPRDQQTKENYEAARKAAIARPEMKPYQDVLEALAETGAAYGLDLGHARSKPKVTLESSTEDLIAAYKSKE